MTDAERARELAEDICAALIDGCPQMLDGQCELASCPCEDDTRTFEARIAAALAAVRSEATASAEQRIAALDREAVASTILAALNYNVGYTNTLAVADAVLALLPAVQPPMPENVRALVEEIGLHEDAYEYGIRQVNSDDAELAAHKQAANQLRKEFVDEALAWARSLLSTPAPSITTPTKPRYEDPRLAQAKIASEIESAAHQKFLDEVATPAMAETLATLRPAAPPHPGIRVRHKKRGTTYTVVGHAGLQISIADGNTVSSDRIGLEPINFKRFHEGDRLVVYRGDDGRLWARDPDEFNDGRFEPAEDAPVPADRPVVPEDVQRTYYALQDAFDDVTGVVTAENNARMREADTSFRWACLKWVQQLLSTPATPTTAERFVQKTMPDLANILCDAELDIGDERSVKELPDTEKIEAAALYLFPNWE